MSEFVEMKTAELNGPALDWAVAKAADVPFFQMGENWPGNSAVNEASRLGPVVIMDLTGKLQLEAGSCFVAWSPSTDWSQGGLLIEKHRVGFGVYSDHYFAATGLNDSSGTSDGPTHLIAACRAIVSSVFGETVSVPKELLP